MQLTKERVTKNKIFVFETRFITNLHLNEKHPFTTLYLYLPSFAKHLVSELISLSKCQRKLCVCHSVFSLQQDAKLSFDVMCEDGCNVCGASKNKIYENQLCLAVLPALRMIMIKSSLCTRIISEYKQSLLKLCPILSTRFRVISQDQQDCQPQPVVASYRRAIAV